MEFYNSTKRFSNRVHDYVKYRPGYPKAVLKYLQGHFNLTTDKIIVDIGAGTGISSELFLDAGYTVWAVEPNKEMREKSIELLSLFSKYKSFDGTAENSTIPDDSADFVVAGQAFHWFDVEKSKAEFNRILKTGGIVALIWNERKTVTEFEKEYEELIVRHGNDYLKIDHRNINDKDIESFFFPATCTLKIFDNYQTFDFEGLKGRLLSSSYMPAIGDPGNDSMLLDLEKLFEKYNENNLIRINYDTKLYAGIFKQAQ